MIDRPVGLYIHVPFCRARCHFCAFYLEIYRQDRSRTYVQSLIQEIALHAEFDTLAGRRLKTIYFGGGTPTVLEPEELCHIVSIARNRFGFEEDDLEVCLEAHPDTVTKESLEQLASAGFNRISFGLQSTVETELRAIGRVGAASGAVAVEHAHQAGLKNVNVDLIYALPGQTLASWRTTLERMLFLQPTHVSCYSMTVEEHTELQKKVEGGHTILSTPELQQAMEEETADLLGQHGYDHYEISNYSRPGYACRHNLLYWTNGEYLGLGPSAQSYVNGTRFGNSPSLASYTARLMGGHLPICERETLTAEQRLREAIVFGLRRLEGVDLDLVQQLRAVQDATDPRRLAVERFLRLGHLEQTADRLRLTSTGRRYADSVAEALI